MAAATLARVSSLRVQCLFRTATALAGAAALSSCASNPYLKHYTGVRCPPVSTAHVSVAAPTDATLIGTSDFVIAVVPGNPEAIQAAERVGADIVQWDRAFERHDVVLRNEALAGNGLAPSGPGATAIEQEGTWYRVHARFWRSNARGGFPPAAPMPAPPPAEPQQIPPTVSP